MRSAPATRLLLMVYSKFTMSLWLLAPGFTPGQSIITGTPPPPLAVGNSAAGNAHPPNKLTLPAIFTLYQRLLCTFIQKGRCCVIKTHNLIIILIPMSYFNAQSVLIFNEARSSALKLTCHVFFF